ncbi:hypothetical protein ASE94_00150 [Devosia sp. Leaf64]|nr:hypothetical protein ASE94_00150 [Devosia sp. Leaf64]
MVLEHGGEYASRWAAVVSVSQKFGCSAHALNYWVKKAEVAGGRRAAVSSEVAEKLMLWSGRTKSFGRPTRSCAKPPHIRPG